MGRGVILCFLIFTLYVITLNAQQVNLVTPFVNSRSSDESRIVGGSNVALGQIPSHASLRTLANVHFCGASIISNRWLVSAAHCTINRSQNGINVVVGTVTLNAGGVTHRSVSLVQHPLFNTFTLLNDISLIQIASNFAFTAHIQTINLGIIVLAGGQNVEIAGFGSTEVSGPLSNNLQRMTATTLTNADCASRLVNQNRHVGETKVCTLAGAGVGTCSGTMMQKGDYRDGGGPLIFQHQLVGVVSWNVPCAQGFPDGHERISSHRQWILDTIS